MNLTGRGFDPQALRDVWAQVCSTAPDALADAREQFGVDFADASRGTWEPEGFGYAPVTIVREDNGAFTVDRVVFALGDHRLVTSQPVIPFPPFNDAITHMRQMPELALAPHSVMYALLHAMNETDRRSLTAIRAQLDAIGDTVLTATQARRPAAVLTTESTLRKMAQTQRALTYLLRAQASLMRAARRLYYTSPDPWQLELVQSLQAELTGLEDETTTEYDMLRFLQQMANGLLASPPVRASATVALVAALSLAAWSAVLASALFSERGWSPILLGSGIGAMLISLVVLIARARPR